MSVKLGALTRGHRNRIREILDATSVFRKEEVAVALELFDETFAAGPARAPYDPGDGVANYEFVGSFAREGQLVGYVCYGATPGTDRVYAQTLSQLALQTPVAEPTLAPRNIVVTTVPGSIPASIATLVATTGPTSAPVFGCAIATPKT